MATGFRNLTVYRKAFAIILKSLSSQAFRLQTEDCGLETKDCRLKKEMNNYRTITN